MYGAYPARHRDAGNLVYAESVVQKEFVLIDGVAHVAIVAAVLIQAGERRGVHGQVN